jgi:hypothetical protein
MTNNEHTVMWLATLWGEPKVEPVHVVRSTAAFYWRADSPDRKYKRETSYESIHETFEEAKDAVISYQSGKLIKAKRDLEHWEKRFETALNLKKPGDNE